MSLFAFVLYAVLQAAPSPVPVVVVLDDANPTGTIKSYRWSLDGQVATTTAKPTPCTECVQRTYQLTPGTHTLILTPIPVLGKAYPPQRYEIVVEVEAGDTERKIKINLNEQPPQERRP